MALPTSSPSGSGAAVPTYPPAADQGFAGWSFDPATATASSAPASGTLQVVKVRATTTQSVTKLWSAFATAGATLTAGQNLLGLYDSTGTLLATSADMATSWAGSPGPKSGAISATQVTAGSFYYIAILAVGTTTPAFVRGTTLAGIANANATSVRFASGPTAQTSMPSSITTGSLTSVTSSWWVGMS